MTKPGMYQARSRAHAVGVYLAIILAGVVLIWLVVRVAT